jgi:hypothetical protein
MMSKRLKPSLATIEARLCGPSDALIHRWLRRDPSLPAGLVSHLENDPEAAARRQLLEQSLALESDDGVAADAPGTDRPARPDLLLRFAESVRRRMAVASAHFGTEPAAGQIRTVERLCAPDGTTVPWDFPQRLMVMLRAPAKAGSPIWYGWMVAPDVDYASYWDMVLETRDEPRDPRAELAQAWNTLLVDTRGMGKVVGQLTAERLAALQALFDDFVEGPSVGTGQAAPGELIVRTVEGHRVVTGTPYGAPDSDPRLEYQSLYHAAAQPVLQHARAALDDEETAASRPTAKIYRFPVRQHAQRYRISVRQHDTVAMAAAVSMGAIAGGPNAWLLDGRLRLVLHVQTAGEGSSAVCELSLESGKPLTVRLLGDLQTARRTLSAGEAPYRSQPFRVGADVTLEIGGLVPEEVVHIPLVPEPDSEA